MKKATVVIAMLLLCIGTLGYQAIQAQSAASVPVLKIAVVDAARVLSQCQENMDRQKSTKQWEQKIKQQLDTLRSEANALEADLKNAVEPGSAAYSEKLQQWFDKRALIEARKKGQQEAFNTESQAWMQTLYNNFITQVNNIAQQEKISLVLAKDAVSLQGRSLADMYSLMGTRKMLYNAPWLDITDKVLNNLDRQYELSKTKK